MRVALIGLAALLAALAAPSQSQDTEIVVTGQSLADTRKALEACIARKCPPDQDIDATVAHAENQFIAGDYKSARATLLAGRGRNRRHARDYPVAVSELLRANVRVAAHLGETDTMRLGTIEMVEALKAGLSKEDPRVLAARVELADSWLSLGKIEYATESYRAVVRDAQRLGQRRVEGYALLRLASLQMQLAKRSPVYDPGARKALDALIRSPVPEHRPFGQAARVLLARLEVQRGNPGALDAVLAELRATRTGSPVLIHAEPIDMNDRGFREGPGGPPSGKGQLGSVSDQWVDIGFWVAPDGRTTDVEILRASRSGDPPWVRPVIASIRSRRYVPLKLEQGDPGVLRVERYSLVGRWTFDAGARMRIRIGDPVVEMLDLSVEEPGRVGDGG